MHINDWGKREICLVFQAFFAHTWYLDILFNLISNITKTLTL